MLIPGERPHVSDFPALEDLRAVYRAAINRVRLPSLSASEAPISDELLDEERRLYRKISALKQELNDHALIQFFVGAGDNYGQELYLRIQEAEHVRDWDKARDLRGQYQQSERIFAELKRKLTNRQDEEEREKLMSYISRTREQLDDIVGQLNEAYQELEQLGAEHRQELVKKQRISAEHEIEALLGEEREIEEIS